MNKAIFIDKDGTLIPDIPYNVDPERIALYDDASTGLLKLQKAGYLIIVITNQSGIALGYITTDQVKAVETRIRSLLSENGIRLTGFLYCPHHPEGKIEEFALDCECRKPQPGMLLKAAVTWEIDLKASWMLGDILNDVEAGNRAGCRTILIDKGGETLWEQGEYRTPHFIAGNLLQAADYILIHN
jgi:D-glycero-D-manno-heptose 1,7-bisphosphate phosphatase